MGGEGLYGRPVLACDSAGQPQTSGRRRAAIKAPHPYGMNRSFFGTYLCHHSTMRSLQGVGSMLMSRGRAKLLIAARA